MQEGLYIASLTHIANTGLYLTRLFLCFNKCYRCLNNLHAFSFKPVFSSGKKTTRLGSDLLLLELHAHFLRELTYLPRLSVKLTFQIHMIN